MAATYSSFMTTRFYSPVFNTALFDGPFRIYFSQSYESVALKMYHLLQTEHRELWDVAKEWSLKSKEHVFLLIYPDIKSVKMIFAGSETVYSDSGLFLEEWEEGVSMGLTPAEEDQELHVQLQYIQKNLKAWLEQQCAQDFKDVVIQN